MTALKNRKCTPCEGGVAPLSEGEARTMMHELEPDWMLIDGGNMLARTLTFENFIKTMEYVNKVAKLAEQEGHHPDFSISYNTLSLELMTHSIDGLSENDFILASKIDEIE
ncbi:hypothetical protein A2949_02415 [Candidatus Adlerbacteria bacterium RIFCSPLOWO2_01_FULL_54_21b]|uniref:Putative pterin-4-alpha-carbinolamine dehydratase n=1 Tax=Candidatus Adlerbacteria bacterium RIFCSPLOWO2_01_FULL_54_21b TaxID=1797245 RepID=A0A1F4XYY9_9BACT|nr:MAG: hypothetical protein A2949_02415 [Candidatus Adlerbacteria bacterium RIFCSPLOWO2_01_FULL_54_21b]